MDNINAYKTVQINTADRIRIISLMYDGAINFIKLAKEALEKGEIAKKGIFTGKATAILGELTSALNLSEGGKIAENLQMLYDFILDRLLYGNLHNNLDAYDEAIKVLSIIRDGWKEMEKNQQPSPKVSEPALTTGVRV